MARRVCWLLILCPKGWTVRANMSSLVLLGWRGDHWLPRSQKGGLRVRKRGSRELGPIGLDCWHLPHTGSVQRRAALAPGGALHQSRGRTLPGHFCEAESPVRASVLLSDGKGEGRRGDGFMCSRGGCRGGWPRVSWRQLQTLPSPWSLDAAAGGGSGWVTDRIGSAHRGRSPGNLVSPARVSERGLRAQVHAWVG